MGLVRTLLRQGRYLGPFEAKTLQEALARHSPMGNECRCGEKVSISDWEAWINHQYEVVLLVGRRMGPRFWE